MPTSSVNDIVRGDHDANHFQIIDVYASQTDRYAVYQTEKRVIIAYSDDPLVQKIQRKRLASLAAQRSEIDGLLNPWRQKSAGYSRLVTTARQFDGRVASALIEALEGETDAAKAILTNIQADLSGELASRARLGYVAWSLVSAVLVLAVCWLLNSIIGDYFGDAMISARDRRLILAAMSTGVLGALYSIAMRIEQRALTSDVRRLDYFTDSFVRLGLGAMGAFILGCFLVSGAIEIHFGNGVNPGAGDKTGPNFIFLILIGGVLAGFVERLVPDLLNSYAIAPRPAPAPPPAVPSPVAAIKGAEKGSLAASELRSEQPLPQDEAAVTNLPSAEEDIDGCDVHLDDPAQATSDEDLPPTSGGVARH